jgi:hypothetical protein
MTEIKGTHEITYDEIDAINTTRLWHSNKSPSALEKIRKLLARLHAPATIQRGFSTEIKNQAPYVEKLKDIVKKITGKEATYVPMDKVPEYREKNQELWKEYLAAKRAVDGVYKNALQNYVTDIGSPQPINEVREHLESQGIEHRLPHEGFTGLIGADGRLYTKHGDLIVPGIPSHEAKIIENRSYDPEKDKSPDNRDRNFVFTTILPTKNAKGESNTQYYYTDTKQKQKDVHKFDVVQQMLKIEKKIVGAWRKDLMQHDDEAKKIMATQCEITYLTAMRIGGKDNENKKGKTYGLTTLLVGNVKRKGNAIVLEYIGKDSAQQSHKITPDTKFEDEVIHVINVLIAGKKRAELLWENEGVVYGDSKLRAYFKTVCSVPGATPHKIRHMRGTRLAMQELPKLQEKLLSKRNLTQSTVDSEFKASITKIGKLLGHVRGIGGEAVPTWSTALANYIDPGVVKDFYSAFEDRGIRMSKSVLNAIS